MIGLVGANNDRNVCKQWISPCDLLENVYEIVIILGINEPGFVGLILSQCLYTHQILKCNKTFDGQIGGYDLQMSTQFAW